MKGAFYMTTPYRCPNCKTNKTRFNLIKQVPQFVKMDPNTGNIMEEYSEENLSPFHMAYRGPELKVQCAACGLIEDEKTFIKFGEMK
jgi:rubredoxin